MTKIVQIEGGSYANESVKTRPSRTLVAETDNYDLLLHDGVTPGGRRILSQANSDARYQEKIAELNGFAGFGPASVGFMVRTATASYALRKLTVNGANLQITSGDGLAGDTVIGLAPTITSEHTWSGQQLFQDIVQFDSGINADVFGNVTGNVTGNLTGNATGNHHGTFDGTSSGTHAGNLDVRGKTVQFDNAQIPNAAVAGLNALVSGLVNLPVGIICMWSGSIASIPAGWGLCNGTNGTPDLRDRFVAGAGGALAVAAVGGSATHTHTATTANAGEHDHVITVAGHALTEAQIPAHKHANGICDAGSAMFNHGSLAANPTTADSVDNNGAAGTTEGWTTTVGGGLPHSHTATSDSEAAHSHAVTVDQTDGRPPYYALAYIMRLAA